MTQSSISLEPRNILMISDDFLPAATGVGSHLQVITRDLVTAGYKVCMITSRRRGEPAEEVWNGVKIFRTFSVKIAGFYQALASQRFIESVIHENQIQIIHHHYLSFLLEQTLKVGNKLNIPQIYTYHMSDELLSGPIFMRPFRHLIHARSVRLYNLFQRIISPSRNVAAELVKTGVHRRIDVISNPVAFKAEHAQSSDLHLTGFNIFFAGRLAPEKNIPLLIKAFAKLSREYKQASLWIAGSGGELNTLIQLSQSLGIADRTRFLGHLDHKTLANYYSGCDVFVLPSTMEVQGIVVLEAMRFSKPVIVTKDNVSANEIVDDTINGYIIDSKDEMELVDKLRILINSPETCLKMGKASYAKSHEFEPDVIMSQLKILYSQVFEEIKQ